jgi:hypothetical protein
MRSRNGEKILSCAVAVPDQLRSCFSRGEGSQAASSNTPDTEDMQKNVMKQHSNTLDDTDTDGMKQGRWPGKEAYP